MKPTITITIDINQTKIIIYLSKFILIDTIQNDYKRLDKFWWSYYDSNKILKFQNFILFFIE